MSSIYLDLKNKNTSKKIRSELVKYYKGSKFIILDEATSSLDDKTEKNVIESLDQFGSNSTLIVIAHRLKTISKCDIIYEVNDGKLLRNREFCPDENCGPGVFLAVHKDRVSCGKCGYTRFN